MNQVDAGDRRKGIKAVRVTALAAFTMLLVPCVGATSASAEPLSMTFTEARANVGVQLSDAALFEAPDTAPFAAQIDPGSGLIAAGELQVPEFSTFITDPVDADVAVEFKIGIINGTFSQATGALNLSGEAGGTLTANGKECTVSTTPAVLNLSTLGTSGGAAPRSGAPFTAGLTGPGAIAGQWTDMQATPVDPGPGGDTVVCETVDDRIGGPGGIWLEQKGVVVPPSPPQTTDQGGGNDGPPPPPPPPAACIVPKLAGKTPAQAKAALRAASCTLGKVGKPRRSQGKGRRSLVVRSSSPAAGASPANGRVHLKLGPRSREAPPTRM